MTKSSLNIENLPSNSKMKVKQVATGKVVVREKPFLLKLFGDNLSSIGEYILYDVLLPAAKATFSEIVNNSIEMMLYGEPSKHKRLSRDGGRTYVSYNSIYDRRRTRPSRERRVKSRHSFSDVILDTRQDAEEVLGSLVELIDTYEVASVADFYAAVGLESEWSDNKYGWDNLASSEVRRVRDGYALILPKPEVLD